MAPSQPPHQDGAEEETEAQGAEAASPRAVSKPRALPRRAVCVFCGTRCNGFITKWAEHTPRGSSGRQRAHVAVPGCPLYYRPFPCPLPVWPSLALSPRVRVNQAGAVHTEGLRPASRAQDAAPAGLLREKLRVGARGWVGRPF